tara:strand:+ start:537 stop:1037 length:501 start_codon:yes stop_codon:yes gene_type:complete
MSDYRIGYASITAQMASKLNNDLHCANNFPTRMYKRMEVLVGIRGETKRYGRKADQSDPYIPAWVTANRFANRLTGLTDRGEFYLNILKTASDEKMRSRGWAGMYFASSKEEQQNKEANAYMRPTYTDVTLMEDATDPKYGAWLNPLGEYFTGRWVKHDEKGYHRL